MNVSVLTGPRTIEIQERELPVPGAGEVRIKVGAVGVCGSDVHWYERGRIGETCATYPMILGHEPAGIVDAVGAGVKLPVGARVAVEPAMSCMHCAFCLSGRPHLCPHVAFLGTPPTDGIFSQYRVMPEHACMVIPDSMSLVEAAMLEPLGVGFHAVKLARIDVGETVAIFGSGPIGLVTMLAARAAGAGRIYMTDLVPERLAKAKQMGADEVMNASEGNVIEWIRDLTHGAGIDATFEATGEQEGVTQACLAAKRGARALLIGIPTVDELTMPMHECRRKELTVQHVRRSNGEALAAMDMVASGRIDVKSLATHLFPLEKLADAFELVSNYGDGVIRAVALPNGDIR